MTNRVSIWEGKLKRNICQNLISIICGNFFYKKLINFSKTCKKAILEKCSKKKAWQGIFHNIKNFRLIKKFKNRVNLCPSFVKVFSNMIFLRHRWIQFSILNLFSFYKIWKWIKFSPRLIKIKGTITIPTTATTILIIWTIITLPRILSIKIIHIIIIRIIILIIIYKKLVICS